MNKKIIYTILVLILGIIIVFAYNSYINRKEINNDTKSSTSLIGGDKDKYGCLVGAGYQWCPSKGECQRLWEGNCPADFIKTVTFVDTKDGKVIYYEEPGKPALVKTYIFDGKCKINNTLCSEYQIDNGKNGKIEGISLDSEILITKLEF